MTEVVRRTVAMGWAEFDQRALAADTPADLREEMRLVFYASALDLCTEALTLIAEKQRVQVLERLGQLRREACEVIEASIKAKIS